MRGPEPRPEITSLPLYVPGATRGTGKDPVIKLSSNESALGPSPAALRAYREYAETLRFYPDTGCLELRHALAERHGLEATQIVCGNGSDQVVHALTLLYAGPGDEVVFSENGFLRFKLSAISCGATPVSAREIKHTTSVDALLASVTDRTKVVLLANPNNPTGTYIPTGELERLWVGLPRTVLLVIDSAYAEFVESADYSSGESLVGRSENVVMTRTFSKAYGLAGVRVGWAYGPERVIETFNRARLPFPVSGAAQAAGVAALHDEAHLRAAIGHNARALDWVAGQMRDLGMPPLPSATNFNTCRVSEPGSGLARSVMEFLTSRNILVRPLDAYGLDNYLRITVGLERQNEKLIDGFSAFVHSAAPDGVGTSDSNR